MTVTTGTLPSYASEMDNVINFNPTDVNDVGTSQFSVTVTDPDGREIIGTVTVVVHPNQAPQLHNPPSAQIISALHTF